LDTKSQNHYEILGLWRDASDADIRRAYRHLALLHHPDVSPESDAAERFRAIREAYDVLVDPAARAGFDVSLGADVGFGRARPRAAHDTRPGSGRRAPPRRSDGIPDGWTPTEASNWNADAWLKANATPLPVSPRALAAEARRSWKTLGGFLAVLALAITACALVDSISGIGTVVSWLGTTFALPLFLISLFIFLLYRANDPDS